MAKVIKYKALTETNNGTEADQITHFVELFCPNQISFDANYPIAEKEAVGEIIVEGEFDAEAKLTDSERIAELEEALELLLSGVTE